jgi:pimeloyl-ACP methyl ester carboxylesterase
MRNILYIILTGAFLLQACERLSNRPDEFADYDSAQYERLSINYEILGDQDTCLVFIHGWNLDLRYWDDQVKQFGSRYRILTLDLAGHGNSSRARANWTAESFARDIITILEKEGVTKAVLIGHGLGGDIALEVATRAPERVLQLIGIDCFRDVGFEVTEDYRRNFKDHFNLFKRNYADMADQMARQNIRTHDRKVISRIVNDYKEADPKVALAIYKNMIPKAATQKYTLQHIRFPLVLIGGDYATYDTTALNKYTHRHYKLFLLNGGGQFPMVEQPEELNKILEQVLRLRVEGASS